MGNCLARTRQHERLDDFPEHSFDKQQVSTEVAKAIHKRGRRFISEWQKPHIFTELDDLEDASIREESPNTLDTISARETSLFSFPQEEYLEDNRFERREQHGFHGDHGHSIAANKRDSRSKPIENPLDRWSGKKRGGALELRLAKNKYLQLATSGHDKDTSPISMDSSIRIPSFFSDGQTSSNNETLMDEFENTVSSGVVWEEYTGEQNVTVVAMSLNGNKMHHIAPLTMAIGTEDGTLVLVEILDQRKVRDDLPGDARSTNTGNFGAERKISLNGRIRAIDFSPDGTYLVAGGDSCVVYVMRITRHSETQRLEDVTLLQEIDRVDRIYAISFSHDSRLLSVGGFDSSVSFGRFGGSDSGDSLRLTEVPVRGLVLCLDWNKTKVVVGTSGQNGVTVIDESFQVVRRLHRHAAVEVVRWKPDGSLFAVGDRELVLFDALTFRVVHEPRDIGPSQEEMKKKFRIKAMCFSPDGSFLVVGGSDGICHVVESKSFATVYRLQRPSAPASLAWGRQKFQSRGYRSYLGIADNSRAVVLFKAGFEMDHDTEDGSISSPFVDGSVKTDGHEWVLRDGSFRDVEDVMEQSPERMRAIGAITSIAFSRSKRRPNSSYLAYVSNDCSLTILSTRDWKIVLQMEFPKPIQSISFSYSNNYLALGGDEGVLYVLYVPNRSMILNMMYDSPIQIVAFSRHDERLSIGMSDGVLSLLAPNNDWKPCGEIDYNHSPVLCQDWCSSYLAVGREDGSVTVFDKDKALGGFFEPVADLSDSSRRIRSVSFGTGGRFLVFGGDAGNVSIANRKEEWSYSQIKLRRQVLATKWSPGGRYVVFTGLDQTLRMIDTLTGDEVQAIRLKYSELNKASGVEQDLTCVDFSKDGNYIVFGCSSGNVIILRGPDWELVGPTDRKEVPDGYNSRDQE